MMSTTILLVDDDAGVRHSLREVLTLEGYRVLTAAQGREAISLAAAHSIDLVLLDLNLPLLDGWNTFAALTNAEPALPVIIITARSNQRFTALGAGVAALMEKPLDFPRLLAAIRRLLAESPAACLAQVAGQTPAHPCAAGPGMASAPTARTSKSCYRRIYE